MDKDLNNITLTPPDRNKMYDSEQRLGTITLTRSEKVELSKLVGTKVWEIIKYAYVKQRLMQIAVTSINGAQTENDLWWYKGKASEADNIIKGIERIVKEFNKEEETKKAKKS